MNSFRLPALKRLVWRAAPYIAAAGIGAAGITYVMHEHNSAQALATQNLQMAARLNATHKQLDVLVARVDALASSSSEAKPSPSVPLHAVKTPAVNAAPSPAPATTRHTAAPGSGIQDQRLGKLQSQIDAQGREIEQARNDFASARSDLNGSIARTHDELARLEKKGERNYYEFDMQKSRRFRREGPLSVKLKKANVKHQYADLQLIVDDRTLTEKHVNLYQPVVLYRPDSPQPTEIVINNISRDRIHGYISAPMYRRSELAAASGGSANSAQGQAASPAPRLASRQRLPLPGSEPYQP